MSEWKNGLPPVGEVCEGLFYRSKASKATSEWCTVEVLKVTEYGEVACLLMHRTLNGRDLYWTSMVRPIKSVEERKRDEAVDKMQRCFRGYGWQLSSSTERKICNVLLDNGYRKVNPLTDDDIEKAVPSDLEMFKAGARWTRSQILGDDCVNCHSVE